jgi:hypothetical protein
MLYIVCCSFLCTKTSNLPSIPYGSCPCMMCSEYKSTVHLLVSLMNNVTESNCTESIMSIYVHSSLVLTGTSFDSSYQLQLSSWSFDRTLSLSVHVPVPYESVETAMNLIVRKQVRHELTNTVAVRSGIGQILESLIQSHSCRFPALYCPMQVHPTDLNTARQIVPTPEWFRIRTGGRTIIPVRSDAGYTDW